MMRRLQINLRKYRRDMGETKISREFTGDVSELKRQHHSFLIESANQYPDKLFVIIIDAVNQFHSGLGSLVSSFFVNSGKLTRVHNSIIFRAQFHIS